jgi:hypothetical protein
MRYDIVTWQKHRSTDVSLEGLGPSDIIWLDAGAGVAPMKRRVVLAIGIDRCGNLPSLPGAVYGAKQFAEWAIHQSYDAVDLITDESDRKVRFDDIRAKVREVVEALDVSRLILFFAGHGCSTVLGDFWLLSNYNTDSDEVISVALSEAHARRCGIDQVSFISDACRNATRGQQFFSQRSLFQKLRRPTTPAQWDRFAATDIDATAQEITGNVTGTGPGVAVTESYGIFTNCLMQALNGNVIAAFDGRKSEHRCISSASLATYLEKTVLSESSLRAQPQYVDAIASWRPPNDIYASFPKDHIIPSVSGLDREIDRFHRGEEPELDEMPRPPEPERRTSVAADKIRKFREQRNRRIRGRSQKFAKAEGSRSSETHTGIILVGSAIKRVAAHPSHWSLRERNANQVAVESELAATVLMEITEGNWIAAVAVPGFITSLLIERGLTVSLAYAPSANSRFATRQAMYQNQITPGLGRWTALMEAGKTPDTKSIIDIVEVLRGFDIADPAVGIIAAHAYERAGHLDELKDLANFFVMAKDEQGRSPGWVPFDLAFLSGLLSVRRSRERRPSRSRQAFRLAGSFPLMSQGWGYLEADDDRVPWTVLNARQGLLPALWTTFDATTGAIIADEIENGRLA